MISTLGKESMDTTKLQKTADKVLSYLVADDILNHQYSERYLMDHFCALGREGVWPALLEMKKTTEPIQSSTEQRP